MRERERKRKEIVRYRHLEGTDEEKEREGTNKQKERKK